MAVTIEGAPLCFFNPAAKDVPCCQRCACSLWT